MRWVNPVTLPQTNIRNSLRNTTNIVCSVSNVVVMVTKTSCMLFYTIFGEINVSVLTFCCYSCCCCCLKLLFAFVLVVVVVVVVVFCFVLFCFRFYLFVCLAGCFGVFGDLFLFLFFSVFVVVVVIFLCLFILCYPLGIANTLVRKCEDHLYKHVFSPI